MKHAIIIVGLISFLSAGPAAAQTDTQQNFGQVPPGANFEITHLAGDVYRYRNLRHYSVFAVTPEGVILGDPISAEGAEWLKKELRDRFDTQVKIVAYSHYHQDHAAGGAVFADTATFISHENSLKYFQPAPADTPLPEPMGSRVDSNRDGFISRDEAPPRLRAAFASLDADSDGTLSGAEAAASLVLNVHPPQQTFKERMTIELGGQRVELIYPGPSHTDDSVVMYFPKEKIVHAVDFITVNRLPRSMGAWSAHVPSAIAAVEALDFDIISAGHEGIGNKADVVEHREYVEDLLTAVRDGVDKGLSAQEIVAAIDLAEHDHLGLFEDYLPDNVRGTYAALTAPRTNSDFEYVYLTGTEIGSGANLPFTPAVKITGGNIVFLSGITGAPVPHSHPHVPEEFDHLDFGAAAQTKAVMERLRETIRAAGGELTDIVQVTRFIKDIGNNQDAINVVMNEYWGNNHRPATTSIEIVRLATDPRFILEVEAVAVIPD